MRKPDSMTQISLCEAARVVCLFLLGAPEKWESNSGNTSCLVRWLVIVARATIGQLRQPLDRQLLTKHSCVYRVEPSARSKAPEAQLLRSPAGGS